MDVQYFHEFCVLAEIKNFLEAADELDIAQSTLSRHLQSLETELGSPLFIRTTRQIKLSEFGKILLPYAQQILDIEQNIRAEFSKERRLTRNTVAIGSVPIMPQYNITELLARFQKEHTRYALEITESESAELKDKIRDGSLNFAFVRELEEKKNEFHSIPYTSDKLAVILPKSHPLSGTATIRPSQLRTENFLLLPEDTLMHKLCVETCKTAGFTPNITYTSYRASNIIDMVTKGMGITLLSKRAAAPLITTADTAIIDLVPAVETKIDFIWLKDRDMTYACKTFLAYIKNQTLSLS
ncbi:MAG: LysR family transcriptional regulator [Spirochaetaceae bacterium]|jgi:DNA-binding transcriptional LysR family regulator|nr:LysR family transcriptional regulator [Spirochaetaceae bacterium]